MLIIKLPIVTSGIGRKKKKHEEEDVEFWVFELYFREIMFVIVTNINSIIIFINLSKGYALYSKSTRIKSKESFNFSRFEDNIDRNQRTYGKHESDLDKYDITNYS